MSEQISVLFIGFLLTTVVGGLLGYLFQRRTWDANRQEAERHDAAQIFDELSRTWDRRLYRMRQLNWQLGRNDRSGVEEAMQKYREAVVVWNENLNRNLALANRYFGDAVWVYLDKKIFEDFVSLGKALEDRYAGRDEGIHISRDLDALSKRLYHLNRYLIQKIQKGEIGLYQAAGESENARSPWE